MTSPITKDTFSIKLEFLFRSVIKAWEIADAKSYSGVLLNKLIAEQISVMSCALLENKRDGEVNLNMHSTHQEIAFATLMIGHLVPALEEVIENRKSGMPITLWLGTEQGIIKDSIRHLIAKCEDFFNKQSEISNHKSH